MLRQRSGTRTADHVTVGTSLRGWGPHLAEGASGPPCRAAGRSLAGGLGYLAPRRPGLQCARSVWLALGAPASARPLFRSCVKSKWESPTQPALARRRDSSLSSDSTSARPGAHERVPHQTRERRVHCGPCPLPHPELPAGWTVPRCCREGAWAQGAGRPRQCPGAEEPGCRHLTDKAGPGPRPGRTRHQTHKREEALSDRTGAESSV